jgi:tripartite-type tricarboxylate transporter receptor subunit TctC
MPRPTADRRPSSSRVAARRPVAHRVAAALAVLVAGVVATPPVAAQNYPVRPIRLIVGFAPAGAADYLSRAMAEPLGKAIGQSIVVENRPGAGSSLAAEFVAKAPPDGYTVLIASPSSISVNPSINPNLGYTPKDLAPITKVSLSPMVVTVNPGLGVKSLRELIEHARKNPGKLNYASSGNGSAPHLSAVLFSRVAQVDVVHVPFRGGGPAMQSVLAGDTQFTFATAPSSLPLVRSGRLSALAVSTRNRSPLVPDLPGMEEAGLPGYDMSFWYGFFVPAATPASVVKRIFDATQVALRQPEVKAAFEREGTEVSLSDSPEGFAKFLQEDAKFWVNLAKGVKID